MTDPLSFWLGDWDVHAPDGTLAGSSSITRGLSDRVVLEHWHGASGVEGMSVFWPDRAAGTWRQLWVTDGGWSKLKQLVPAGDERSVRFQGAVSLTADERYDDRTTLTPLEDGRVHQLIEASPHGCDAWETTFDAVYTRRIT